MTTPLLFEHRDNIAIITINGAPYNQMTLEFIDQLETLVGEIETNEDIRAVVLTGSGLENFSVGMNLKQLPEGIQKKGGMDSLLDQRLALIAKIENMHKPWIATLYGYCLGGGLEIPLGCHFRMAASEGAQIGLPEMDLGSVPAWGGSARLCKRVGASHTLDLVLRGKKISGPEAYRIGLVNEVWPLDQLKEKAIQLALDLAAQPATAIAGMLSVIVNSDEKTLDQLLKDERRAVMATMGTADQKEGIQAFMEKRKPIFNQ